MRGMRHAEHANLYRAVRTLTQRSPSRRRAAMPCRAQPQHHLQSVRERLPIGVHHRDNAHIGERATRTGRGKTRRKRQIRGDRNACDRPRTLHRLRNMRRRLPDRGHRPAQTRRPIARTPSRCRAAGHGRHRRVRLRAAHRAGARQIRPGYRGARTMRRAHRCEPPGADGLRRSLDHKVDLRKL